MHKKEKVRYLYTLEKPYVTYNFRLRNLSFKNEWIFIDHGYIRVKEGYSWNGNSPKINIFGKIIGTPEGEIDKQTGRPKTWAASLCHDCLYQFVNEICLSTGIDKKVFRKKADGVFYDIMQEYHFKNAEIYYKAVRMFGWLFV